MRSVDDAEPEFAAFVDDVESPIALESAGEPAAVAAGRLASPFSAADAIPARHQRFIGLPVLPVVAGSPSSLPAAAIAALRLDLPTRHWPRAGELPTDAERPWTAPAPGGPAVPWRQLLRSAAVPAPRLTVDRSGMPLRFDLGDHEPPVSFPPSLAVWGDPVVGHADVAIDERSWSSPVGIARPAPWRTELPGPAASPIDREPRRGRPERTPLVLHHRRDDRAGVPAAGLAATRGFVAPAQRVASLLTVTDLAARVVPGLIEPIAVASLTGPSGWSLPSPGDATVVSEPLVRPATSREPWSPHVRRARELPAAETSAMPIAGGPGWFELPSPGWLSDVGPALEVPEPARQSRAHRPLDRSPFPLGLVARQAFAYGLLDRGPTIASTIRRAPWTAAPPPTPAVDGAPVTAWSSVAGAPVPSLPWTSVERPWFTPAAILTAPWVARRSAEPRPQFDEPIPNLGLRPATADDAADRPAPIRSLAAWPVASAGAYLTGEPVPSVLRGVLEVARRAAWQPERLEATLRRSLTAAIQTPVSPAAFASPWTGLVLRTPSSPEAGGGPAVAPGVPPSLVHPGGAARRSMQVAPVAAPVVAPAPPSTLPAPTREAFPWPGGSADALPWLAAGATAAPAASPPSPFVPPFVAERLAVSAWRAGASMPSPFAAGDSSRDVPAGGHRLGAAAPSLPVVSRRSAFDPAAIAAGAPAAAAAWGGLGLRRDPTYPSTAPTLPAQPSIWPWRDTRTAALAESSADAPVGYPPASPIASFGSPLADPLAGPVSGYPAGPRAAGGGLTLAPRSPFGPIGRAMRAASGQSSVGMAAWPLASPPAPAGAGPPSSAWTAGWSLPFGGDRPIVSRTAIAAHRSPIAAAGPVVFRSALPDRAEPGEEQRAQAAEAMATSTGVPLSPLVRRSMEHALGMDLAAVRVHSGPQIARAADLVSARAMARGTDVYLPEGVADSPRAETMPLLAHELTHVAQHLGHRVPAAPAPLTLAHRAVAEEQTADRIERRVTDELRLTPVLRTAPPADLPLARMAAAAPVDVQRAEAGETAPTPTATVSEASPAAPGAAAPGGPDAAELAEKVYSLLERRLIVERERGGYRR
jgi:hypothetical protein